MPLILILILIQCSEFIRDEKNNSANPQEVNVESLGLNICRRPPKKLPPTHIRVECGSNYGIDPQTGKQRNQPLLFPTPIISLKEILDILVFLPNSKWI